MSRVLSLALWFLCCPLGLFASPDGPATHGLEAENLAPRAVIQAASEYSDTYRACNVADGVVPAAGSQADAGWAWCVQGATHGQGADLVFTWSEPTPIRQIVYYGRTAWYENECWKTVQILANDHSEPLLEVDLEMRHGPQAIVLPETATVRRLTLRFTASHGGFNPGASEILIFDQPVPEDQFPRFLGRPLHPSLRLMPWVDQVNTGALRRLIERLAQRHGAAYGHSVQHLAELARLDQSLKLAPTREADRLRDALARLQRQVLLFDVDRLLVIKRHEIHASHVYTYHYEGFRPGGGLYVLSLADPEAPSLELASSPEGQILDGDLSYDGRRVLYSLRETEADVYQVWSVNIDGTDRRPLTSAPWHSYNACWLPDGGVAFLSARRPAYAYCWDAPVGVVHRMDADGANVRMLSANYLNDFTPYVLNDGRIIYSRWEYVDKPAIPIQSLWTLNPDGTGLSMYFGNGVLSPGTFMEARSIPGTDRIVCVMTGHNGPTRGALGVIDRSLGVNAQEAIRNITPDVPVPAVDRGDGNTGGSKQYSNPLPLDGERLLASIQGPLLVRNFAGDCQSLALPAPEDGMQYFNAQPVRPRPRPPVIPSALDGDTSVEWAEVVLQDVYRGLAPEAQRGAVRAIRVVQEVEKRLVADVQFRAFGFQFPVVSCGATYAPKRVWGDAPVEADGSARFRVPANRPIYFIALDAQGRAVQRMRSFTHLMPGEQQGCVGCHESRLSAGPTLHRPNALRRTAARDLTPPEWGVTGFSYPHLVQPVLDRHCADCHNPETMAGGVDLSGDMTDFFNVSYEYLARKGTLSAAWDTGHFTTPRPVGREPYVNWIPTFNGCEQNILEVRPLRWGSPVSPLADLILDGHRDGEGSPRVQLSDAESRRILAWIDLNVPYYGVSVSNHYDREGCRRMVPPDLDAVLRDVAHRRCASCHGRDADGTPRVPRDFWLRVERPEYNAFLRAPLAREAGGTEQCGAAIFASTDDPDYRAILATFDAIHALLEERPRMDMLPHIESEDCRDPLCPLPDGGDSDGDAPALDLLPVAEGK